MTEEQINIAIAEFCGWRREQKYDYLTIWPPSNKGKFTYEKEGRLKNIDELPSYCSDLNAIREAEKLLTFNQAGTYERVLKELQIASVPAWDCPPPLYHATAQQKAKAMIHAIGKWTETGKEP